MSRTRWLPAALLVLVPLASGGPRWLDRSQLAFEVPAAGLPGTLVWRNTHSLERRPGERGVTGYSSAHVRGLAARAPVDVAIRVGAKTPRDVTLIANDRTIAEALAGPDPTWIGGRAFTTRGGVLTLRIRFARDTQGALVRVGVLGLHQPASSARAWLGSLELALLGVAVTLLAGATRFRSALLGVGCAWAGLLLPRPLAHALLPALLLALYSVLAWRLLARALARFMHAPWARWAAAGIVLRLALVVLPAFPSIDAGFHAHKIVEFERGRLMRSVAPGLDLPLPVPYPPALYGLLWPVRAALGLGEQASFTLVRAAMGLLEGACPLLLFALLRRRGASGEAASASAAVLAAMPEGLLVLAKGVAANIFAQAMLLAALWSLAGRSSPAVVVALVVMVLLGHFGGALCFLVLLGTWWTWDYIQARDGAQLRRRLGLLLIAGALAFALYYREALDLFLGASSAVAHDALSLRNFGLEPVRMGKILQDLALKFGALPLLLGVSGLRELEPRSRLRTLLFAWVLSGAALAVIGVTTPVTLRFEYFVMPAVAALAGLGLVRLVGRGHRRWALAALGGTFAVQCVIAGFALANRFELIAVILESPRWPFPFRLG